MRQGALVCASGIGDGLLMMIGAHHLRQAGFAPTVFHDRSSDLSPLFPSHHLLPHLPFEDLEQGLQGYQRVIVQNDHSARSSHLSRLRREGKLTNLTFLFPTRSKMEEPGDILFDPKVSFASNLSMACQEILGTSFTKENDLTRPEEKVYRKHLNRVVFHPSSRDANKNWKKKQFISLAEALKKKGFSVTFCVSPIECREWKNMEGCFFPKFETLCDTRNYLFESGFFIGNDSGIGHLASNLGIPTLTLFGNARQASLWRPDWSLGRVVLPPFPLPNFKGINWRIRDKYWQSFVSVSRVLRTFMELVDASSCDSL